MNLYFISIKGVCVVQQLKVPIKLTCFFGPCVHFSMLADEQEVKDNVNYACTTAKTFLSELLTYSSEEDFSYHATITFSEKKDD